MTILALDTTGDVLCVAVVSDAGELLAGVAQDGVRAQSVLGLVDRTLARAGLGAADVTRVAVGTGPGSFTGVRIGVATARGLASALAVPISPLSTLAAVAWPVARRRVGEPVWAWADAKRGECFMRRYRWISGFAGFSMVPDCDLQVVRIEEAPDVAGAAPIADGPPTPEALAELCVLAPSCEVHEVLPVYGRDPDAVPMAEGS